MDIAVPGDSKVLQKETEKYEKYQDLANEIKRIWKSRKKSCASGSRCIGFRVKEAGRPLGAIRN